MYFRIFSYFFVPFEFNLAVSEVKKMLILPEDVVVTVGQDLPPEASGMSPTRQKKNLSNDERQAIYEFLLTQSNDGKLKKGSMGAAANLYSASIRTVSRIWHRAILSIANGANSADVSSRIAGTVGRRKIEMDLSQAAGIPLRRRTSIRSLANALNVPKSTFHDRVAEGAIRAHSNAMKPYLSEENEKARLQILHVND